MGYNTTIKIINDGIDQIVRYPVEFVDGIKHHLIDGGEFGVGNHANVAQVMRSRHASDFSLYAVHGNLMIEMSPYSRETTEIAGRNPDLVRAYIQNARLALKALEDAL